LTTLPSLPTSLDLILADFNQLKSLPELPPSLTYISCSGNDLISLPSFPHGLEKLYCSHNPLETLPELPSRLSGLACELPHNRRIYISNEMTPDVVHELNRENQEWMEFHSKERCIQRCSVYYEELMHDRWNPDRVIQLRKMGYMPEDI
jgi:Leucine-rich repeat (LRR) protein